MRLLLSFAPHETSDSLVRSHTRHRTRTYLLQNQVTAPFRNLTPLESNHWAKKRGWGILRPVLLLSLCSLLALILSGCAGTASSNSSNPGGNGSNPTGTTVPSTPTGLMATAGNAQVILSWTTSANATSYNLKRSTTTGGPYTLLSSPTAASSTDTTVTNGTTYFYVVSAVNSAGEGANSSEVSARPTAPAQVPATPTGLMATAANAQVSLTWAASATATSYNVKRSITTGGPYTKISSPTATNFTDINLTNGTTYFYVVSAVNATVGSSRVDLQACKLEYSIVSPK